MSVVVHQAAATAEDLQALASRIGARCARGDVLVLSGDLGAGKTTFTQGLARGMGIVESVTSPTFVISRVHQNPSGNPALIHVDAYRLGSLAELEDLDLEMDLGDGVVVVEWGRGLAEHLSPNGLDITLTRSADQEDEIRQVEIAPRDARWASILEEEWSS